MIRFVSVFVSPDPRNIGSMPSSQYPGLDVMIMYKKTRLYNKLDNQYSVQLIQGGSVLILVFMYRFIIGNAPFLVSIIITSKPG